MMRPGMRGRRSSRGHERTNMVRELLSLIEEVENGYDFYFGKGTLNSEGRKLCTRIGVLAGAALPSSSFNVKRVLQDGSDLSVLRGLRTLRELLSATSN